jgi:hypothetical protein
MTVGDGCKLKLGSTGDTISTTGGTGVYDFNTLVVKAGGEVTMTDDLTNMNNKITITVRSLKTVVPPRKSSSSYERIKNKNKDNALVQSKVKKTTYINSICECIGTVYTCMNS